MPEAPPCRVILLGMMGSGKTTVGIALAGLTGWRYHDNDALLAAATGRTARDLAQQSTEALRDAEAAALGLAVRQDEPAIVAAAAGIVLDPALRETLGSAGTVVWLHAPPHVLARRAAGGHHRPWLADDAGAWIERTAAEREPLYRAVADLEVDTDVAPPETAARRILEAVRSRGCSAWLGT
jgi:shikimate kinase